MTSTHEPHDYRQPPPGTAAARDLVCRKCGQKRSVAGHSECPGTDRSVTIETHWDYDPMDG